MLKIIIIFFLLFLLSLYIFINLGNFVDNTQKPIKSDIIVSLGGEAGCRLQEALKLYKEEFSNSKKIIYTGDEFTENGKHPFNKRDFLEQNGVDKSNIIHIKRSMAYNTMEEIFAIKEMMLKHQLKSVIFVSHPWHTGRISFLANIIANYDDAGLQFTVTACNRNWWHKKYYYKSSSSRRVAIRETKKILYNLIKYATPLIHYTRYATKMKNREWEKVLTQLEF